MNDHARVASIAMHSEMGDPEENLKRVEHWMREAHAEGAAFALFTEECVTGSMNKSDLTFPEARKIAEYAAAETRPRLESLCRELEMTAVVGLIEPAGERFLNSALIVGPEGLLATFGKLHLPGRTEKEWFLPGETLPVVTSRGWTFSVGICYDVRFPEIFRTAALKGAELFFLPVGGSGCEETGRGEMLLDESLRHPRLPAETLTNSRDPFIRMHLHEGEIPVQYQALHRDDLHKLKPPGCRLVGAGFETRICGGPAVLPAAHPDTLADPQASGAFHENAGCKCR